MKYKFWLPFGLFLILAMAFWLGLYKDPHKINSPLLDQALPDIHGSELNHTNTMISRNDFMGHLTVLNVFATWCSVCREENRFLMTVANDPNYQLIGIDYRDDQNKVNQWLSDYGNPYQKILFDPKGDMAIELGVYGTPETFLIDRHGIIRYKHIGNLTEQSWKNEFLPLIAKLEQEGA